MDSHQNSSTVHVGDYEYNTRDLIGHGAFAVVFKGRHRKVCHQSLSSFDQSKKYRTTKWIYKRPIPTIPHTCHQQTNQTELFLHLKKKYFNNNLVRQIRRLAHIHAKQTYFKNFTFDDDHWHFHWFFSPTDWYVMLIIKQFTRTYNIDFSFYSRFSSHSKARSTTGSKNINLNQRNNPGYDFSCAWS